ncbi:MAG TPA: DNA-formamidopyrimidine glycosylase family protein [Vicinamibacterales bacterium]|jgi:endonuclease-8|nr:DNA-formamidopyrimidine glycosylase family protein [Vicinamibacterales bacterium]
MPEGDTIFRTARTLQQVFAGSVVTRFESVLPGLIRVAEDRPVVGRTIESVVSQGKHVLFNLSGDLILRTHMRMSGSWHVYPDGARWKRPAREMRLLIAAAGAIAVGFNVPEAEFIARRDLARHRTLTRLGPDLLHPSFDADEALRRVRGQGDTAIADVLLDQRVLAGIGNVFKSEILFLGKTDPFVPASSLSDERLRQLIAIAREQLSANVMTAARTLSPAFGRRTTRSLDPRATLWVYGRRGKPCRRCAVAIASRKTGLDARLTYWCPRCQAP